MIRGMKTIGQYEIMKHIQQHFHMTHIDCQLLDDNSIKITDKDNNSMVFTYEDGEIRENKV